MGSVFALRSDEVDQAWPKITPLLMRIEEPSWEECDVKEMVRDGRAQLWGLAKPDGSVTLLCVLRIEKSTTHKYGLIWIAVGDGLADMPYYYRSYLEPWFLSQGCEYVQINGRKGWKKALPDFKEHGVILIKRLN